MAVTEETKLRALEILRAARRAKTDVLADHNDLREFLELLGFTGHRTGEYRAALRYLTSPSVQAMTPIRTDRGWCLAPVRYRFDTVYLELLLVAEPGASLEELATALEEIHLQLEMGGPQALTPAVLEHVKLILRAGIKIFKS